MDEVRIDKYVGYTVRKYHSWDYKVRITKTLMGEILIRINPYWNNGNTYDIQWPKVFFTPQKSQYDKQIEFDFTGYYEYKLIKSSIIEKIHEGRNDVVYKQILSMVITNVED